MSKQESTIYVPTPKEKILIEIMTSPENRTKSISAICEKAECDRGTYYKAIKKPGFVDEIKTRSKQLVNASVGKVINAFVKEAERGSYPHGKVILEMAGIYQEKKTVEQINKPLTAEEAREMLIEQGIDPESIE